VCRPPPSFCGKRRERAAKARRNRWVSSERLSHHRIMREVSLFEHSHGGAHSGIRNGTRPAPAISGQKPANTRHSWEDVLHDWRPKPRPPRPATPWARAARFAYFAAKARSRLGRGVDASPSFKPQLPLRADLPSRPSPQCPASHLATAAAVSAPRRSRPPAIGRTPQLW
jgi:hypothetical protein